ncbi:hypothetical protein HHK36_026080 [Tetracentron sinense]|uniref:Uncharacterized protein n=1 Tax=Tetracentron sinense TaxID=13715 RepID=A0A834YMD1_TETSI|nr:hypothetical protein HHK36_026080 [Tetracentron sinense]
MASTTCFIIVSRNDIPIYEAEVSSAVKLSLFFVSGWTFCPCPRSCLWSTVDTLTSLSCGRKKMLLISTNSYYMRLWILFRTLLRLQVLCGVLSLLIGLEGSGQVQRFGGVSIRYCWSYPTYFQIVLQINISIIFTKGAITQVNFNFVNFKLIIFVDILASFFVSLTAHIIHMRLMLLHDSCNDDEIKSFFQKVHELYIKVYYCTLFFH